MISLENNYRSTGNILNGALAVIRNNPGMERCLKPWKETGLPVQIAEAPSKRSEAIFVAKEVSRLVGGMDMLEAQEHFLKEGMTGKRSFRDIAVLYRTRSSGADSGKMFSTGGHSLYCQWQGRVSGGSADTGQYQFFLFSGRTG